MTSGSTLTIDWSTIGIVSGLVTFIIGFATTYLKLFISASLGKIEGDIKVAIEAKFAAKEVIEARFTNVYDRIRTLEDSIKGKN